MRIGRLSFWLRLALGGLMTACGMVIALGEGPPAFAGSGTGNISFSANVLASATVTSQGFAAFTYDPAGVNKTTAFTNNSNSVSVTATFNTTPLSLTLDQGSTPCAAVAGGCTAISTAAAPLRQMANGTNRLAYNIFSSSANQTIGTPAVAWGTANGPTLLVGTGSAQLYTLFVTIPAGQNPPAGFYSDTIVETITF